MVAFCQLADGSGGASTANNAFPDRAAGKVYSWTDPFGSPVLLKNSRTDGSLISSSPIATVLGVSGNNVAWDHSGAIINGFMYVPTTNGFGTTNMKISKIDLSTLSETAAVTSAAITYGDQAHTLAFSIGGTDYLALALDYESGNPNFEVINATTMASVVTGQYPNGDSVIFVTPGGVSGTVATFWIWTWQGFNMPYLVKATFNSSGNLLSFTTIGGAVNPTTIDATASNFDDFANVAFDQSTGDVMVFSQIQDATLGRLAYLSRFSITTALPVWSKKLPPQTSFNEYNSVSAAVSTINGTIPYWDNLSVYHEIATVDGSETFTFAQQHFFDGDPTFNWDDTDRVFVFLDPGGFLDTYGWSIWRPDEGAPARWSVVNDAGALNFPWIYRDSGGSDPVYAIRETPDGYNNLPTSGYQAVKRSTADGSIISPGPVWQYADGLNPLNAALPSGSAALPSGFGVRLAGVDGIGKLYFRVNNHPSAGNYEAAIVEIDRTTLDVTQTYTNQTSGENHSTGGGGPFGQVVRGTKVNCLSPDGNFLVSGVDWSYGASGFVWEKIEIWCPNSPSDYNYISLVSLGLALTDRGDTAMCFDANGFLWLLTQPVAVNTVNPVVGQSTLHKIQLTAGSPPTAAIVASYTVPDNFDAYGASNFASTFIYQGISYNPDTDKLYLWSNWQNPFGHLFLSSMEFDIGSTTFAAAIQTDPATPPNNFVHGSWNAADRYALFCETGSGSGPYQLLDVDTAAQTITETNNATEWQQPWSAAIYQACFPFLDLATGAYYLANAGLQYAVNEGFGDMMLLPASVPPIDDSVDEAAAAADAEDAQLDAVGTLAEVVTALDDTSAILNPATSIAETAPASDETDATTTKTRPVWMTITGGGPRRESIFPN